MGAQASARGSGLDVLSAEIHKVSYFNWGTRALFLVGKIFVYLYCSSQVLGTSFLACVDVANPVSSFGVVSFLCGGASHVRLNL